MQVGSSASSGASQQADFLTECNLLSLLDVELVQMPVSGLDSFAVADFNQLSVVTLPAGIGYHPRGSCVYLRLKPTPHI